jgi:hypothetical protein
MSVMKKVLSLLIIALSLVITTATSNACSELASKKLFIRDTLPLTDTAAESRLNNMRKDTFSGMKNRIDTNNLKAKSDSLHKRPPKK